MASSSVPPVGNSTSSRSVSTQKLNPEKPLWQYINHLGRHGGNKGGNIQWMCNFCNKTFQGTYTRVRSHLLGINGKGIGVCPSVPREQKIEMEKLQIEAEKHLKSQPSHVVPSPPSPYASASGSSTMEQFTVFKKRKSDASPIEKAYDMQARSMLDAEIARMFYTGGLPFTLAMNPYYVSSYTYAANHNLSGYVPPDYNRLRTSLLQQEKANVDKLLEPIKRTWMEKGVTIVSDGWSDPQRRPLINIMATSGTGAMFIKTVNCSGEIKDKHFIANLMKEVIDEVGDKKVVQVITDNDPNCKGAGQLIESIYRHIFWTPCVVHTLNLALKNICAAKNTENNQETYLECHWITEVHGDALQVKNFIMNHNMRLSIFNSFSSLNLLSVADTRFASIVVMLKRFKLLKRSLESMVTSEEWATYKEDDEGKAMFVRETLVSETWWEKLEYILAFTEPIYEMIRLCDTDKSSLHLVYEMWINMIEKVKHAIFRHEKRVQSDHSPFFDVVYRILMDCWEKHNTPLHCLAHSLNPRYYTDEWLSENQSRVSPNRDTDVAPMRRACFRRLFPDIDAYDKVTKEYADFSTKMSFHNDIDAIRLMYSLDPKSWWATFGDLMPMLQQLAFKVLGQPTSSSCCERNWSIYSFIHSLRRNRLNPKRAEDLAYIHNNLRILSRNSNTYYEEKAKMWDVGGDELNNMEDFGFLQFASFTLDEPELESEFLINEV